MILDSNNDIILWTRESLLQIFRFWEILIAEYRWQFLGNPIQWKMGIKYKEATWDFWMKQRIKVNAVSLRNESQMSFFGQKEEEKASEEGINFGWNLEASMSVEPTQGRQLEPVRGRHELDISSETKASCKVRLPIKTPIPSLSPTSPY